MTQHTPEPWKVYEDACGDLFISSTVNSKHVIDVGSDLGDDDNVRFDAARIVACVNELAELSTEQIEDGAFRKMREDRNLLLQQSAELLTASKNFYSSVCGGKKLCGHDFECVCPSDLLREAIAKAGA